MDEEQFRIKLKELCLKYDLKHGEVYDDIDYAGNEIYDLYCEEHGLPYDYLDDLYKLQNDEQKEDEQKIIEYFEKSEEIIPGDLLCIAGTNLPIGIARALVNDDVIINSGGSLVLVKKEGLKVLGQREI